MKRYKLVLFDFDGTLADTFSWFVGAWNDLADGRRFRRIEGTEVDGLRAMGPRQLLAHLGISWWRVPGLARNMRRKMKADAARLRPFDGVPDMLTRLAVEGLALAVVTSNAEENVRTILGESAGHIRHWQCRTSIFGKAGRFRAVTRAARVPHAEVLCVGDELRDAEAARAAGIDFAAVTWGYATPEALRTARPALVFDRVDDIAVHLIGKVQDKRTLMISQLNGKNVPIKLWARIEEVESQALDQLKAVAALPWVAHHVAVMPDVHVGKGATVGSVVAMRGAVAPAAVGVDIGCGMAAVKTNLTDRRLPDNLKKIRLALEEAIPVGFSQHAEPVARKLSDPLEREVKGLLDGFGDLSPKVQDLTGKAARQLGTLGGGNHFIELCLDTEGAVWLMLHSGSRNIGKTLAEVHMSIAQHLEHNQALKNRDLAVFLSGTAQMDAYRHDLFWAQDYARLNRMIMLELYVGVLKEFFPSMETADAVHCHHNYVAEETHFGEELLVTRKGAIRAAAGQLGIIPGSMGTKSYIVRGLGNADSFESASHGAGRRMSRGKAKQKFTLEDLREQTNGVECRKDSGVIDEIPGAYKSIDKVMANQTDLVEVVAELKQVLCVKG